MRMCVCYVRSRERDRVGVCVGYVKRRESDSVCDCVSSPSEKGQKDRVGGCQ